MEFTGYCKYSSSTCMMFPAQYFSHHVELPCNGGCTLLYLLCLGLFQYLFCLCHFWYWGVLVCVCVCVFFMLAYNPLGLFFTSPGKFLLRFSKKMDFLKLTTVFHTLLYCSVILHQFQLNICFMKRILLLNAPWINIQQTSKFKESIHVLWM